MAKDYYKILGISRTASKDEIKKSYRRLAHQYHPDKKGGDEARFKEVNEAYHMLIDDKKRSQYDQFGTTFEGIGGASGFGGFDFSRFWSDFAGTSTKGGFSADDLGFEDVFGNMFEGFGSSGRGRVRRGADISIDIEMSLEDTVRGFEKTFELKKYITCQVCGGEGNKPGTKWVKCSVCEGKGRVQELQRSFLGTFTRVGICGACKGEGKKPEEICSACQGEGRRLGSEKITATIPAGVSHGKMLKIEGRGERGIQGASAGDFYIRIHIKKHPLFRRDGDDIYLRQDISFTQAVLGDKIKVPTLAGSVFLTIPAGIETGRLLRLKGKGTAHLYGNGQGDQYIEIHITTPKHPSGKQKELFERLKDEGI